MDVQKKFPFPVEIKEPLIKQISYTQTDEYYKDVWKRDAETVIRGLMRFAGLSEEDMARPASREMLLRQRHHELYEKAKSQPHTHWVPEGWEIIVAANTVAAHYHDGPPGDEPFFVPTICLWEQNSPLVTRWTRDTAFRVEIGGFIRYDRWSCGYCGEHIPPDWEEPYCPYCGAS